MTSMDASTNPSGLPMTSPAPIASARLARPSNRCAPRHQAGVGQREQRQYQVAGPGRDRAQQPVGRRFDAIVDGIQRLHGRRRGAVPQRRIGLGLMGDDGFGLRQQRIEIGWRTRGNQQRKDHAGQRRVHTGVMQCHPQQQADDGIGPGPIDAGAIEQDQRGHQHVRPAAMRRGAGRWNRTAPRPRWCRCHRRWMRQ